MPFQQGMKTLPLYDILATLFPGSTFLAGLVILLGYDTSNFTGTSSVLFFVVFGYLMGRILRWLGRELEGQPVLFSNSRKLAAGNLTEDDIGEGEDEEDDKGDEENDEKNTVGRLQRIFQSIGAIFDGIPYYENAGVEEKEMIYPTKIEESYNDILVRNFNVSPDEIGSGKSLKATLSYLETTPFNRAIQFQSIHSFQRNTWAAMILILFLSIISAINKVLWMCFELPDELVLPGTNLPNWGTLLLVAFVSFSLALIFGELKKQFNELFIEYTFVELYLDDRIEERDSL